jgi:hypothetical protein
MPTESASLSHPNCLQTTKRLNRFSPRSLPALPMGIRHSDSGHSRRQSRFDDKSQSLTLYHNKLTIISNRFSFQPSAGKNIREFFLKNRPAKTGFRYSGRVNEPPALDARPIFFDKCRLIFDNFRYSLNNSASEFLETHSSPIPSGVSREIEGRKFRTTQRRAGLTGVARQVPPSRIRKRRSLLSLRKSATACGQAVSEILTTWHKHCIRADGSSLPVAGGSV